MGAFQVFLVLASFMMMKQAASETIDELISEAAESSSSMDFLHDDSTVLVEMDMVFTRQEWEYIQKINSTGRFKRNALRELKRRWTNNQIPYVVSSIFSSSDRAQVNAAFNDYHTYTCLKFRPATSYDKNRIVLQNGGGCSSYVGMQGGSQAVSLAPGCRTKGVIIHELGHAIGFHHEQTRPDRDQYVKILNKNIIPQTLFNFQRYTWAVINGYNVPYDYSSIMHYGQYAFSRNRQPTIVTKDESKQHLIGNRQGLSFRDVKLVNLMYGSKCTSKPKCPREGFVGKDCQCWCPGSPVKLCSGGGGGGGGGGGSGCKDNHANCASWARKGECKKNPKYMLVNCKKSCKRCNGGGGGGESKCKDNHGNCASWASKGECKKNPAYMLVNCKKSCNRCNGGGGGGESTCVDSNSHCASWAGVGYCKHRSYKTYMLSHCKKSCRACSSGNPSNPSGGATCVDKNRYCSSWASRGNCRSNAGYMLIHCKRSCGQC